MAEKSNLACQVVNAYKSAGKYVFYAEVKPRTFKEGKDPALSYSLSTVASLNIFDTEKQVSVVAYLDPGDPSYVLEKVKSIMTSSLAQKPTVEDSSQYGIYTKPLAVGKYKGMLAAEVVAKLPEQDILGTIDFLKKNLAQYPGNKDTINPLVEALLKNRNGELKAVTGSSEILLLSELKTPDNKKLENGLTLVRQIQITYNAGTQEPFCIEIVNGMAPPANGQIGALVSKMEQIKRYKMTFTEKDFYHIWDEIVHAKEMYAKTTEAKRIMYAAENTWRPNTTAV